jgi:hypothetical protein
MSKRCYYREGKGTIADGIECEAQVFNEADEDALKLEGWKRSPHELEAVEEVDEALEALREATKERGIKGWHRMGVDKLREVLGLDEDGQN